MARDNWNSLTKDDYDRMVWRHEHLWLYVERFVRSHDVQSIVDVGCGMSSPAREFVENWTGVDVNGGDGVIQADFTTMDVSQLPGCDLLLACGVIEHCWNWWMLLEQLNRVVARWIIVTFFLGAETSDEIISGTDRNGYPRTRFGAKALRKYIARFGWNYRLFYLCINDDVLLIENESKP